MTDWRRGPLAEKSRLGGADGQNGGCAFGPCRLQAGPDGEPHLNQAWESTAEKLRLGAGKESCQRHTTSPCGLPDALQDSAQLPAPCVEWEACTSVPVPPPWRPRQDKEGSLWALSDS